jgi:hypothetical protein
MNKKKNELPKTVFVQKVTDDGDEPYLMIYDTVREVAEIDETKVVGEYKLVRKIDVSVQVIVTSQS